MDDRRLRVRAGDVERVCPLVRVAIPPDTAPPDTPIPSETAVREEATGRVRPAQYDPADGTLSFVVDDGLAPGESRDFQVPADPAEVVAEARGASTAAGHETKLDRVVLRVGGETFATYIVAGTRKPYFWPVLGPAGASVVRGQGSADHPHHTGLALSYGGHSEGGSVNIWSDWDEPPYGPGGRMVHRGFRRIVSGPVYGELVQDLSYLDPDGDPFATEVRTVRWWWADRNRRFIDFESRVLEVNDRGTAPFLMMIRTPACFGIPEHGRLTNSADRAGPELVYGAADQYRAAWVDASGPTGDPPPAPPSGPPEDLPDLRDRMAAYQKVGGGPWNGIALLDHPDNHGYPNVVGKYAMVQQLVQAHYPPPGAPNGPFAFRQRVMVHDADAAGARVDAFAADYADPPAVEIG